MSSDARIQSDGLYADSRVALNHLLSSYVAALTVALPGLDAEATAASLRALDQLRAAAMDSEDASPALAPHAMSAERRRCALQYMEAHLESPGLSPAGVARVLGISPRQLHRLFEDSGHSVSAEIRHLRVLRAQHLIHAAPRLSITDIAYACGFDVLATFYRAFKAEAGMTASEFRLSPHD